MPRRISRLGGTTFRRSFMTNAYSPAIHLEKEAPSPPSRLPLSVSRSGSNETAVFGHHAAVLDDADPGAGQCLGGRVIPDAELEPDRARPPRQCQDLGRVARKVFGAAEDLDHVDRLRKIGHPRHRRSEERRVGKEWRSRW